MSAITIDINSNYAFLCEKRDKLSPMIEDWGLMATVEMILGSNLHVLNIHSENEIEECKIREALLNAILEKYNHE